MNVIFISTDIKIFNSQSAVQRRFLKYAEKIERIEVIVFSLKRRGFEEFNLLPNCRVVPTNSRSRWNYIFDAMSIGKKIIEKEKDKEWIVSTQDPFETGLVGHSLHKKFGVALHVQVHTDLFSPYFSSGTLDKIRLKIAKKVLPDASSIRVVSERIKKSIEDKKLNNTPIKVLPIAVSKDFLQKEPLFNLHEKYPQFEKIILVASRLTQEKRITDAISAFSFVPESFNAGLVVVGEGPEREKLIKYAKQKGVEEKVVFELWSDDLVSYYKTADLFLLTSAYEGYGRTLVEASLCGCPIVSTDVGIVGDVLKNEKDLLSCVVGDTKCLADSMAKLFRDGQFAENLAQNAKISARGHLMDEDVYVKNFVSCLEMSVDR